MATNRRKNLTKSRRSVSGGVRLPRWREWGTTRKAFALTSAVLVFVILGVLGLNMLGTGHALDGCYTTTGYNSAGGYQSAYFWDDFYVHTYAAKTSATIAHLGPGCHTIQAQVQCFGDNATVYDNGYYNNWWVYFPDRHGWVNEVHARDGGNNQNSWPLSTVWRASSSNC